MMLRKKIVAGLIGAGRIGKMHAENILSFLPDVFLKAVSDPKLDTEWAERMGIPVNSKDNEDVLNDAEIEAVVIATPSATHVEVIKTVAAARKHIFCEKPIAFQSETIDSVVSLVKKNDLMLQVGFNRRFDPEFRRVKEIVTSGKIGTPHIIRITNRDPVRPRLDFIPQSGGLFMDFSVHDFDMMRYISEAEIEEIYAMGANLVDPEIGKLGDIDTAMITVKLSNGALGFIDLSRETNYGYDQQLEVFGSKGSAMARNTNPTNTMLSDATGVFTDKPHYSFVERYKDAFMIEMREFFEAVRNHTKTMVSGEDARAAVSIARAAQKSYELNKPVRLI